MVAHSLLLGRKLHIISIRKGQVIIVAFHGFERVLFERDIYDFFHVFFVKTVAANVSHATLESAMVAFFIMNLAVSVDYLCQFAERPGGEENTNTRSEQVLYE